MNDHVKRLSEEAARLSVQERLALIDHILAGVQGESPDVEDEWEREIADRVAAYDNGMFETEDADEVLKEARGALKR